MDTNQKREKIVVKLEKVETEITGNDLDTIARMTLEEPSSKSRIVGVPAKGCKGDLVSACKGFLNSKVDRDRQPSKSKPICPEKKSSKRKAKSFFGEENVQEVNTVFEVSGLQCTQRRVKQVKVEDAIEEVKTTLVTTKQKLSIKADEVSPAASFGAWPTTSEPRTVSQPSTEALVTAVASGVGLTVSGQYAVSPSLPRATTKVSLTCAASISTVAPMQMLFAPTGNTQPEIGLTKEVLFADVSGHHLGVLRRVYTRERGTFAKAHQLGAAYRRMNLEFLGSLLVALDRRQVRDVTSEEIDILQTNINGLKMVGFDLGWLERRLENVRVRMRLATEEVHFARAKLRMSEAEKAFAAWKAEGVRLEAELRSRQAEVERVEAALRAFPPTEGVGFDSGVLEGLL